MPEAHLQGRSTKSHKIAGYRAVPRETLTRRKLSEVNEITPWCVTTRSSPPPRPSSWPPFVLRADDEEPTIAAGETTTLTIFSGTRRVRGAFLSFYSHLKGRGRHRRPEGH
jgi:hypothetical protein